tara:strand:- start:169 stop:894 length:726 start_codon:yes stop_codon:yes gene_type:complete
MPNIHETRLDSQYTTSQHIAAYFDNLPIGMAIVAPNGQFIKVNQELCNMLGYTETELLQKTFQDITVAEDIAADVTALHSILTGETERYQMLKEYTSKFGERIKIKLTVQPILLDNETVLHLISTAEKLSNLCDPKFMVEEKERNGDSKMRPRFPASKIFADNWKWFIVAFTTITLYIFQFHTNWVKLDTRLLQQEKKIEKMEKVEELLLQKIMLDLNPNDEAIKKSIIKKLENHTHNNGI